MDFIKNAGENVLDYNIANIMVKYTTESESCGILSFLQG